MHVEQFVYQKLGYPLINVVQPVTVSLLKESNIDYIEIVDAFEKQQSNATSSSVLIVGPCDLEAVDYFLPWNSVTEFRFFDENSAFNAVFCDLNI